LLSVDHVLLIEAMGEHRLYGKVRDYIDGGIDVEICGCEV
jgi:hypothetical protein